MLHLPCTTDASLAMRRNGQKSDLTESERRIIVGRRSIGASISKTLKFSTATVINVYIEGITKHKNESQRQDCFRHMLLNSRSELKNCQNCPIQLKSKNTSNYGKSYSRSN